eukprot:gene14796-17487_t
MISLVAAAGFVVGAAYVKRRKQNSKHKGVWPLIFHGSFVLAPSFGEVIIKKDQLIILDELTGDISEIAEGLIDTHCHAPQYQFTGTGTHIIELMQESCKLFADLAEDLGLPPLLSLTPSAHLPVHSCSVECFVVESCARRTGVHVASVVDLGFFVGVGVAVAVGVNFDEERFVFNSSTGLYISGRLSSQRALIGKVAMDQHGMDSTALKLEIAKKYDVHIQSHISESQDEMAFVDSLHPGKSDTEIYDKFGLLTAKTVMAHGCHLKRHERDVLRARGAAVSHCPHSNLFFGDANLNAKQCVFEKLKLGLGTDVAGGYSYSMFHSIRSAVTTGRNVRIDFLRGVKDDPAACDVPVDTEPLDYKEAFWIATQGGAEALDLQHRIG